MQPSSTRSGVSARPPTLPDRSLCHGGHGRPEDRRACCRGGPVRSRGPSTWMSAGACEGRFAPAHSKDEVAGAQAVGGVRIVEPPDRVGRPQRAFSCRRPSGPARSLKEMSAIGRDYGSSLERASIRGQLGSLLWSHRRIVSWSTCSIARSPASFSRTSVRCAAARSRTRAQELSPPSESRSSVRTSSSEKPSARARRTKRSRRRCSRS
jgi:hypothetical protein